MKTVWKLPSAAREEKRFGKHPAQKPLGLIERCLLASTNEGDFVLDPFLGNGSTAAACQRTKRRCVGIELDARHLGVAMRRLNSFSEFEQIATKEGELFPAVPAPLA